MIPRFVLTGAESTGKSWLAEQLAAHFGVPASPEFVREFVARKGAAVTAEDVPEILAGQRAIEAAALASPDARCVLHDTNVLSTALYARELYGIGLALAPGEIHRPGLHYLLCLPDIPWTPDPNQRESPESREHFHALFVAELQRLALPHSIISGEGPARTQSAIQAIEAVLE